MSVSADGSPRYTLISFATAWGPQHGGINAFNADLLEAVAAAFGERVESVCVVLDASEDEIQRIRKRGIVLVSLGLRNQRQMPAALEPQAWAALTTCLDSLRAGDHSHTIWLGHDRITGPIALEAQRQHGGWSALIHHMSYERYEDFAEGSRAAETKRSEQSALFKDAQHIFAVGPLLKDALSDLADRPDGHLLIPGLAEIEPRKEAPKRFKVFLSGRLHPDARKIKQAHLGLAGFGRAVALCDGNRGLPDALRGECEPGMRLRGVDFEHEASQDADVVDAEDELKSFVERYAERVLSLSLLPFTQDRHKLFDELRGSSVALMPSWHEGFGLVGWEAIAAGVPLIVSRKSGLYRLLKDWSLDGHVLSLDPKGSNTEPFFSEEDCGELAQALIQVAKAPDVWRLKAAILRQRLLDAHICTWPRCAETLVAGLGLSLQLPTPPATAKTWPVPVSALPSAVPPKTRLLEMPGPRWQAGQGLALSQLLRAEERVVPFDSAHSPFLEKQLNWVTGTDTPQLSVRLLTGRGGTGKTRLALELCHQLHGQGWEAGLLPSRTRAMDAATTLASSGRPCLVVVDYAETRQQQVLDLLKHLLEMPRLTSPVRLLLLARAGGEWWAQFPSRCAVCEALLLGAATSGPYDLPPLHRADADRLRAYRTALQHFADRLRLPLPNALPDLSAERLAHPLHLQMTALLALRGEAPGTVDALTRALLAHENRYWLQAANHLGPDEQAAAATLMTVSTLCGGFAVRRDAEATWQQIGLDRSWLGHLWAVLQPLYPGAQGLDGLRPDLLGEALVAQALLGSDQSACLEAVLGNGSAAQRRHALTVLARVLRTRDDVASPIQDALQYHFARCAQDVCEVGLTTPSPLTDLAIAAFAALRESERVHAAGMMQPWLHHDALPLTRLAVAVRCSESDRAEAKWKRKQSQETCMKLVLCLHALSISYAQNGQGTESLLASQRALEICRSARLSVNGEDEIGLIAQVLGHHAGRLSEIGRNGEAISTSEEALSLHRRLTLKDANRFEPDLSVSLSNHAIYLAEQGRHREALGLSQEALKLCRKLAERRPERFEPDLARSLNNHAVDLVKQGLDEDALNLSQEALTLSSKLASRSPERFEPDLATSLGNHALRLADQGRCEEALELSRDALELNRKLAERLPERFEPDLASSLGNHANRLAAQGRNEEALELSQASLTLRRKLAERLPERFEPDLAKSLGEHALRLAEQGRDEKALELSQEAVKMHRNLAEWRPERFEPDLATSLSNHAALLADQGRDDEVLDLSQEALELCRKLAERLPERFRPALASSLNNHANCLAEQGRYEDALDLSQEALKLRRTLAERLPERFEPGLATSLGNHALRLAEQGRNEEALELSQEALKLDRKLAGRLPGRFEPDLIGSLDHHAKRLSDQGRYEEALDLSQEALKLRRKLAERLPGRFEPELATGLYRHALHLASNGHLAEALNACGEAATRLQTSVRHQPRIYGETLGHALLWAELLGWISTGPVPAKRADIASVGLTDERSFKSLPFRHTAFGVLFAASTPDRDLRSEALACRQAWDAMDRVQQAGCEDVMLVVSAVLHARQLPSLEHGWQERWRRFAGQRQGHIPQWMPTAAQRARAGLPEF